MRIEVFVPDWQIECCGAPPGVGDAVEWRVVFRSPEPDAAPELAAPLTVEATARPWPVDPDLPDASGAHPTELDAAGLHFFWHAPQPVTGPVRVTGHLYEDHHIAVPPDFPPVTGVVRRVRVVSREFVRTGERAFGPSSAPPTWRDVGRSPKWFHGQYGTPPYAGETGVLVELEVAD